MLKNIFQISIILSDWDIVRLQTLVRSKVGELQTNDDHSHVGGMDELFSSGHESKVRVRREISRQNEGTRLPRVKSSSIPPTWLWPSFVCNSRTFRCKARWSSVLVLIKDVKTNFSVLYIEKLESYKQMMATVISGGWMNFSVLGMRVKSESVEKFSKMLNFQICLKFFWYVAWPYCKILFGPIWTHTNSRKRIRIIGLVFFDMNDKIEDV